VSYLADAAGSEGPPIEGLLERSAEAEKPVQCGARARGTNDQSLLMSEQALNPPRGSESKSEMFPEDTIDKSFEDGWNPKPPHGENERQSLRSHDAFLVGGHVR